MIRTRAVVLLGLLAIVLYGCASRPRIVHHPLPNIQTTARGNEQTDTLLTATPLVRGMGDEIMPSISPSGRFVAYTSNSKGNQDIYLLDLQTGSKERLTRSIADDYWPAFSPDGERIAFISNRFDAKGDLFLLDLNSRKLVRLSGRSTQDRHPVWLDNRTILLSAKRYGKPWQVLMIPDETDDPDHAKYPVWATGIEQVSISPDGKMATGVRIAANGESQLLMARLSKGLVRGGWKRLRKSPNLPVMYPTFWNGWLLFSAIFDDTNGDGRLSASDEVALARCRIAHGNECRIEQLTSSAYSSLFVQPTKHGALFASSLLGNQYDIVYLPFPATKAQEDAERLMKRAERTSSLPDKIFLWRRATGAALASGKAQMAANILLEMARAQIEDGKLLNAQTTLEEVSRTIRTHHLPKRFDTLMQISSLALEVKRAYPHIGAGVDKQLRQKLLGFVPRFLSIANQHQQDDEVRLRARLHAAEALIYAGETDKALSILSDLIAHAQQFPKIALQAEIAQGHMFAVFGDMKSLARYFVALTYRHSNQPAIANTLALRAIEAAKQVGNEQEQIAFLRELASKHAKLVRFWSQSMLAISALQERMRLFSAAAKSLDAIVQQSSVPQEVLMRARLKLADLTARSAIEESGSMETGMFAKALVQLETIATGRMRNSLFGQLAREEMLRLGLLFAQSLAEEGNYSKAFDVLNDTVLARISEPTLASYAWRELVSVAYRAKRLESAKESLDKRKGWLDSALYYYVRALLLAYSGKLEETAEEMEDLVERSIELNPTMVPARILHGWLLEMREFYLGETGQGFLERAIDEYETAYALHSEHISKKTEADILLNLGNAYYLLNNKFDWAYQYYKRRAELNLPFASKNRKLVFLSRYGRAALLSGHTEQALSTLGAALDLARKLKNEKMQAFIIERLAFAYYLSGDYKNATRYFRKQQAILQTTNDTSRSAIVLRNLALCALNMGDKQKALKLFEQATKEAIAHSIAEVPYTASMVAVGPVVPEVFPLGFGPIGERYLIAGFEAWIALSHGDLNETNAKLKQKQRAIEQYYELNPNKLLLFRKGVIKSQQAWVWHMQGNQGKAYRLWMDASETFLSLQEPDEQMLGYAIEAAVSAALQAVTSNEPNRIRLMAEAGRQIEKLLAFTTGKDALYPGYRALVKAHNTLGVLHMLSAYRMLASGKVGASKNASKEATTRKFFENSWKAAALLKEASDEFHAAIEALTTDPRPAKGDRLDYAWMMDAMAVLEQNLSEIDALAGKQGSNQTTNPQAKRNDCIFCQNPSTPDELFDTLAFDWVLGYSYFVQMRIRSLYEDWKQSAAKESDYERLLYVSELEREQMRRDLFLLSRPHLEEPKASKALKEYFAKWNQVQATAHTMPQGLYEKLSAADDEENSPTKEEMDWLNSFAAAKDELAKAKQALKAALGKHSAWVLFGEHFKMDELLNALAENGVLVEFVNLGGRLSALVVSKATGVQLVNTTASLQQVYNALRSDDTSWISANLAAQVLSKLPNQNTNYLLLVPELDMPNPTALYDAFMQHGHKVVLNYSALSFVRHARVRNFFAGNLSIISPKKDETPFEQMEQAKGIFMVKEPLQLAGVVPASFIPRRASGQKKSEYVLNSQWRSSFVGFESLSLQPNDTAALGVLNTHLSAHGVPSAIVCNGSSSAMLEESTRLYQNELSPMEAFAKAAKNYEMRTNAGKDKKKTKSATRAPCRFVGWVGLSASQRKNLASAEVGRLLQQGSKLNAEKRFIEAAAVFERLLAAMESAHMMDKAPAVYKALVAAYSAAGQYQKAANYQMLLLNEAKKKNDILQIVQSHQTLATLFAKLRKFEQALMHNQQACDIFEKYGKKDLLASMLYSRGLILERAYRFEQAHDVYMKAMQLAKEVGARAVWAQSARGVARIDYLYLGNYMEAVRFIDSAMQLIPKDKPVQAWQLTIDKIRTLRSLGKYMRALEQSKQVLGQIESAITSSNLNEQTNSRYVKVLIQAMLESIYLYWYMSDYPQAIRLQQRAYELAVRIGSTKYKLQCLNILGLVYSAKGLRQKAIEVLRQALELARSAGMETELATIFSNMATVFSASGNYKRALFFYRKARTIDERLDSEVGLIFDHANMAITYVRAKNPQAAIEHADAAIALMKRIPSPANLIKSYIARGWAFILLSRNPDAKSELERAIRLARRLSLKDWLWRAQLLLARNQAMQGKKAQAIKTYQRAQATIESMPVSGIAKRRIAGGHLHPADVYEELADALIDEGKNNEALEVAERFRKRLTNDIFSSTHQGSAKSTAPAKEGNLNELAERLGAAHILAIEFFATNKGLLRFALGANGIQTKRIPIPRSQLAKQIESAIYHLRSYSPVVAELDKISRVLISDLDLKDVSQLLIVSNDPISALPPALLRKNGKWLVESMQVIEAVSLSELAAEPESSIGRNDVHIEPSSQIQVIALTGGQHLQFVTKEANRIALLFPNVSIHHDSASSLANVLDSATFDVLHIAAHGNFLPDEPLSSKIAMDSAGKSISLGYVASKHRFDYQLALLSSCGYSGGDLADTRLTISVGGAFLRSGAKAVLAARYRIDDLAAARMMKWFYQNLSNGEPIPEALRKAYVRGIRQEMPPFAWSMFSLIR